MLYQDDLITITEDLIVFRHYYFPTGRSKTVPWNDIQSIAVLPPSIRNGQWRIHGTGNFKVWFPRDKSRPRRDRIFHATLKGRWVQIGFTVEDGEQVEAIFRNRGVLAGL